MQAPDCGANFLRGRAPDQALRSLHSTRKLSPPGGRGISRFTSTTCDLRSLLSQGRYPVLESKESRIERRNLRGNSRPMATFPNLAFLALILFIIGIGTPNVVASKYGFVMGYADEVFQTTKFDKLTQFAPHSLGTTTPQFEYNYTGPITRIGAGFGAAVLAIDDSVLVTWGLCQAVGRGPDNPTGNCSLGITADFRPSKIAMIGSGDYNYAVLLDNGTVYTFGLTPSWHYYPNYWFRGRTDTDLYHIGEIDMTEVNKNQTEGEKITDIVTHSIHAILLTSAGRVFTFGTNLEGGLGQERYTSPDDISDIAYPPTLTNQPKNSTITGIFTGRQTFLLLDDGSYMCYGFDPRACDGDFTFTTPRRIAQHYTPPFGLKFKRFLSALETTFAWDTNDTIWVWGHDQYIPTGRDMNCNGEWCKPRPLEEIPGGGRIVDLCTVDGMAVYALTERNLLFEIYCPISPDWGTCDSNRTWQQVDLRPLPAGHVPTFSRTTSSGRALFLTTQEVPLCQPSTPPSTSESWSCINGLWTLFHSPSPNTFQPLAIESPVVVRGNLSIDTSTPITISPTNVPGSTTIISIESCLTLSPGSSITLDLTQEPSEHWNTDGKSGFKETTSIGLFEYDAVHCETPVVSNLKLNVKQPSSCKRYNVLSTNTGTKGTRGTLTMLIEIDKSRCNYWWIILVSCIGFVIVVVAVVCIIYFSIRKKKFAAQFPAAAT